MGWSPIPGQRLEPRRPCWSMEDIQRSNQHSTASSLLRSWHEKNSGSWSSLIIVDLSLESHKLWGKELHFDLNSNFWHWNPKSAAMLLWAQKVARYALFLTLTPCCCRSRCCPVGASERLIVPAKANGVEIMSDTARLNLCPLGFGTTTAGGSLFLGSFQSWKKTATLCWSRLSTKATGWTTFSPCHGGYPCRLQHRRLAGMAWHLNIEILCLACRITYVKWGSSDFLWSMCLKLNGEQSSNTLTIYTMGDIYYILVSWRYHEVS